MKLPPRIARIAAETERTNMKKENTTMKKKSSIFINVAVAAVFLGLARSLQAVPPSPPANVLDGDDNRARD